MIPDTALRNNAGQIALKWRLSRPAKLVKIDGTDRYYVPTYAHNVALYWINEEDVPRLLGHQEKTCNCNHGTYQQAYMYANEIDVNLHKCGNRHCD